MTITLTGFMGCGKSSVGRELARRMGARFVDLDEEIVERQGRSIPEIFKEGEDVFRAIELDTLRSVLDEASDEPDNVVLALGGGALSLPEAQKEVFARSRSIFLRTRLETIRRRVGATDPNRPLFSNADVLYARRSPIYSQAEITIDTDDKTPAEIAEEIILCTK